MKLIKEIAKGYKSTKWPFFCKHMRLGVLLAFCPLVWASVTIMDFLVIIWAFGKKAYFEEGLRFANSKKGILSNGQHLAIGWEIIRASLILTLIIIFMWIIDIIVGILKKKLKLLK